MEETVLGMFRIVTQSLKNTLHTNLSYPSFGWGIRTKPRSQWNPWFAKDPDLKIQQNHPKRLQSYWGGGMCFMILINFWTTRKSSSQKEPIRTQPGKKCGGKWVILEAGGQKNSAQKLTSTIWSWPISRVVILIKQSTFCLKFIAQQSDVAS